MTVCLYGLIIFPGLVNLAVLLAQNLFNRTAQHARAGAIYQLVAALEVFQEYRVGHSIGNGAQESEAVANMLFGALALCNIGADAYHAPIPRPKRFNVRAFVEPSDIAVFLDAAEFLFVP